MSKSGAFELKIEQEGKGDHIVLTATLVREGNPNIIMYIIFKLQLRKAMIIILFNGVEINLVYHKNQPEVTKSKLRKQSP